MLRKVSILVASSAMSLVTITAVAQPAPQPREPMTREAVATHATTMFTRLDANADGQLTDADREARADQRGEARFERLDSNGDGAISRTEFDSHHDQMQQRRQARVAAGAGEGAGEAAPERRRGPGMARGEGQRGPMMGGRDALRTADADSNGAVSQAEFTAALLARFDAADANNDGTVTREERRAMRPAGGPEGRGHRGR